MRPGCINFISATAQNNGITAYIANNECLHPANTITVSYNGSVGEAFYQTERFWASDDINVLYPRFKMSEPLALFFIAVIRPLGKKYSYTQKWTKEKMEKDEIILPVDETGRIDFTIMEKSIRTLEQARIRALEVYLLAAGFTDTTLTATEEAACSFFSKCKFKPFKLGGHLFDVLSPTRRFNANTVTFGGTHPYVVRTSQNNGQRDCIIEDEKWLSPGKTISFGQDTATIFYQDKPYFTGDKIKVMCFRPRELNEKIAVFLLAVMRKSFASFSWGVSSFNENVLKDIDVLLPVNVAGEIDYDFMETFIKGMMKRAIAGIMEWKDHEIATTKTVVENTSDKALARDDAPEEEESFRLVADENGE